MPRNRARISAVGPLPARPSPGALPEGPAGWNATDGGLVSRCGKEPRETDRTIAMATRRSTKRMERALPPEPAVPVEQDEVELESERDRDRSSRTYREDEEETESSSDEAPLGDDAA